MKFFVLFIVDICVYQYVVFFVFNEQVVYRLGVKVIFVGFVFFLLEGFGYYVEYGVVVQFEIFGFDNVDGYNMVFWVWLVISVLGKVDVGLCCFQVFF